MITIKKMENMIGLLLTLGILVSACLVLVGTIIYLIQHGHELTHFDLLQNNHPLSFIQIWQAALSFSSLGLIELGLLLLVITQFLRVAMLAWFYFSLRDKWFTIFSLFILLMLLYSFIWRN